MRRWPPLFMLFPFLMETELRTDAILVSWSSPSSSASFPLHCVGRIQNLVRRLVFSRHKVAVLIGDLSGVRRESRQVEPGGMEVQSSHFRR